MKHLFLLQLGEIPLFIKSIQVTTVTGYVPNKEGNMAPIELSREQLPIDEDMVEEIREILK
tara:strand:+ start:290 stop:472 length:183 start_codon:yes stop_codon:yes gene_type:complete